MTPPPSPESDDLTPEEKAWVRNAVLDDQYTKRLRERIKVVWPWFIAIVSAIVATVDWIQKHIRWTGPS